MDRLKQYLNILVLSCLFFLVLLSPVCAVHAASGGSAGADGSNKVIRVGLAPYPGYAYKDSNGIYRGIDVEYTENIAQKIGCRVKIVLVDPDTNISELMQSGKVDCLGDISYSASRAQTFLFSDYEQGSSSSSIVTRKNDNRYSYGDVSQISKMRIGLNTNQNYRATKLFREWCTRHDVYPRKEVAFSSYKQMQKALDAGKIDGQVIGAEFLRGYTTILKFSPTRYYYCFRKNDTALKTKFDTAMSQIIIQDPNYISQLRHKYLSQSNETYEGLTKYEKTYIKNHGAINVAVLHNDQPYYYTDLHGKSKGIIPDYYARIASATGLHFKFTAYDAHTDAVNAVLKGQADIIGMYSDGLISAHAEGLAVTRDYSEVTAVMITKSGTAIKDIKTIAVKSRSLDAIKNSSNTIVQHAKLKGYTNADAGFEALKKKEADAVITGSPSSTWLINQTTPAAYNTMPLQSLTLDLCGAARYNDKILLSIMDKGINKTEYSFEGIVNKDTMPASGLRTFIGRIPSIWIVAFAAVMILLVLGLIFALISLRRRQKEKAVMEAKKAETDRREIEIAAIEKNAEEKNQFFSNISHDMRTPLNAIIGFSELAEKEDLSPQALDYIGKIKSSGSLLRDLINDTLTLSKANSGKLELHLEPVFTEEIGSTITMPVRSIAEEKNISLIMDKSGYRPRTILTDRLNLQKIFLNILNNAVRFTPEGGTIWVTVKDEPAGSADPDTIFTVRDTGIGMTEEYLLHIYEPFSQETRHGYESLGTGLGLSIVKKLVDAMGGTIDVQSKINEGTMFTLTFHFEETGLEPGEEILQYEDNELYDFTGMTILLCEDNILNQEVAKTLLEDRDITVEIACSGKEGLEKFRASDPWYYSAVLMDIRMPEMNGLEASRAIRSLEREDASAVPIIAMTADAFEDDIQKCFAAGMNGHIAKPIEPAKMFSAISRALLHMPQ